MTPASGHDGARSDGRDGTGGGGAGLDGLLRPASSLRGELRLPSDKSVAHRALMASALACVLDERAGDAARSDEPVVIALHAPGEDVLATVRCLGALGVDVALRDAQPDRAWVSIELRPGRPASPAEPLDCGNSGTTMRLLAGLIAGLPIGATLDGDDSLRGRPMERLAEPLRAMGARVETTDGHAPISVWGTRVPAALEHRLPVASAQLLGAICLAALSAGGETRVLVPGPTRDHTERLLAWMGVPIERHAIDGDLRGDRSPGRSPGLSGRSSGATVTAIRGPVRPGARSLTVPGDPSAATPWLVAAALHPDAELRLVGVGLNPTRLAALELLREMGADIEILPWPDAVYSVGDSAGRGSVAGGGPVAETAPVHAVGDSPGHGSGAGAGPSAERAPVHAVGDSPGHGSGAGAGPSAERAPVHAVADSPGPEPIGDVVVRSSGRLRAVRIGGERVAELIDELPVLAVAMAAAEGTSELRDAGELRVKESDRIAAVVEGLGAIGARVEELPDGWRVRGGVPRGWAGGGVPRDAAIATRGDHRIAIAFAVAALAGLAASVRLDDPACVAVSYPTFWDDVAHATGSTPRPATSAAAVGAAGR